MYPPWTLVMYLPIHYYCVRPCITNVPIPPKFRAKTGLILPPQLVDQQRKVGQRQEPVIAKVGLRIVRGRGTVSNQLRQ